MERLEFQMKGLRDLIDVLNSQLDNTLKGTAEWYAIKSKRDEYKQQLVVLERVFERMDVIIL